MAGDPKLVAVLEARLDKFEKALKEAGKVVDEEISDMEKKFESKASNMGSSFGGWFLKGFIGSAAVTGIIATIGQAISKLDELGNKSSDYRLPVEELQALSLGARVSSVSVEELSKALGTFTTVSKTSGRAAEIFYDALENISPGLNKAFENAPTQSARLRLVMDALAATQDEAKRATLAFAAFGSDADRVIEFFARGATVIDDFRKRAHDLGITITDAMVRQASDAQNQLTTLAQIIQNKLLVAIAELIPALRSMIPTLENIGRVIRDAFESFVDVELRSTSGLQDLLATNEQTLAAAEKRYAELTQSLKEKPPSGLAKLLGDAREEEMAELEKTIAKYREAVYKIQAIIENRANVTPEGGTPPPASNTPGAFKRRDDTRRTGGSDAFERQLDNMEKKIRLAETEAQAVGLTTLEHDRLRAVTELQNAAIQAGIPLNEENNRKIEEMALRYAEAAERVRQAKDQWKAANDLAREFGNAAIDGIDALVTKSKSLNQVLSDTLRSFAKMAAQAALLGQGPLAQFFGTAPTTTGGTGGLFGSVASGLFGLFGGARAEGGDVQAGKAYVVGEKRPEIFVPGTAGRINPNKGTGQRAGNTYIVQADMRDSAAVSIAVLNGKIDRLREDLPDLISRVSSEQRRLAPLG